MTIQEMREIKQELGYSYEQISELSGVPLGTVQKIFGGATKSPRYDTLRALENVFIERPTGIIREDMTDYHLDKKQPGEYTVEDYYAIPDEFRTELIDGVFYDMATPNHRHQLIAGEIFVQISTYIRKNKGKCIPEIAPIDVQLDCDNKTMVQPDVLITCDRDKLHERVVYGAPDFVVEILSPSTRKKDVFLKLHKYENAGVREYWIVDPDKKRILVYDFNNDEWPTIYGFQDKIPVRIFGGDCVIDFVEIDEYISFLYH